MSTFFWRMLLMVVLLIVWNVCRYFIGFEATVIAALSLLMAYEGLPAGSER